MYQQLEDDFGRLSDLHIKSTWSLINLQIVGAMQALIDTYLVTEVYDRVPN